MEKAEVYKKIAQIVAEIVICDVSELTYETKFKDLKFDSLDCVEFVMELEDEYNISIPDYVADEWAIIDDAVIYMWSVLLNRQKDNNPKLF